MYIKNTKKKVGIRFFCLIFMLSSGYALAQSPVDSGALLRQDESVNKNPVLPLSVPNDEVQPPEIKDIKGESVLIRELKFSGAVDLLSDPPVAKALEALIADAVNQKYDFTGLTALADKVTLLLKKQGWILARAYLPRQDVSDGVLTIAIVQGQLDSLGPGVIIESVGERPLRVDPALLEGIATEYLVAGQAVNEQELERALLLINDLPGLSSRARLEAGEAPESTRIHILTEEGALFTGQVQANNFGNRFTGRSQLQSGFSLNDLSGRGDLLDASFTASEGIELGRISYGLPLGYRGWYADFVYTRLDYEVVEGQAAQQADYTGDSHSFDASLRYPLLRSSTDNLWVGLGYRADHFKDRFNGALIGDKEISSGHLSLSGDHVDRWQGGGRSDWSLAWQVGDLDLSNLAQQQQNDRNAFNTEGTFHKLEYSLSRYQYLTPDLSLYLRVNGQFASKNLDSSQKFFAGGPNGVRAYPGSEAPADEGQLLRAELRYNFNQVPRQVGRLQLQLFYDQAWIKRSDSQPENVPISNAENANHYRLAGAGIGLNFIKEQEFGLNVSWARKVGNNPGRDAMTGLDSDEERNSSRLWLQGVMWF